MGKFFKFLKLGIGVSFAFFILLILTAQFMGYEINSVKGNSMEPTYSEGDMIVTRPAKDLKVGDVIVFYYNQQKTVHRIIEVDEYGYRTKGDAEGLFEEAQLTPPSEVIGEAWIHIPAFAGIPLTAKNIFVIALGITALSIVSWPSGKDTLRNIPRIKTRKKRHEGHL